MKGVPFQSIGASMSTVCSVVRRCPWRITESGQNYGFFRVCYHARMRDFVILFIPLIVTVVRLSLPGGLRSVVAESVLVRHQLRILNR